MQLRDHGLGFSPITLVLHWVGAILVFSIIVIEAARHGLAAEAVSIELIQFENALGLALFFVSAYRLWARLTSFHPLPCGAPNPVEVIISRSVALALTLAGVLLPIAAWLSRSAGGEVIGLPGGLVLPPMVSPNSAVKQVVDILFNIGASAFLAGLALHIFGAMKNHLILKNDALRRMFGKKVEL